MRVVRFKEGGRSVTDYLNKSETKVTRYRQSWKKDDMCLSFAHSFLRMANFLNTKWKQDFSTQNFDERFSRFRYKTPYNFSLTGLLPFVRNAANSSRHVHPNPELNFHNSTLFHYTDSVNTDKRFRAGRPRNLCSISEVGKNISVFQNRPDCLASGPKAASHTMGTDGAFPGGEAAGAQS